MKNKKIIYNIDNIFLYLYNELKDYSCIICARFINDCKSYVMDECSNLLCKNFILDSNKFEFARCCQGFLDFGFNYIFSDIFYYGIEI